MRRDGDWIFGMDFINEHGLSKSYVSSLKHFKPKAVKKDKEGRLWINPKKTNFLNRELADIYQNDEFIEKLDDVIMRLTHYYVPHRIGKLMSIMSGKSFEMYCQYTVAPVKKRKIGPLKYMLYAKRILKATEKSLYEIGRQDYIFNNCLEIWDNGEDETKLTTDESEELLKFTTAKIKKSYKKSK